jgi:hypothetical protein
VAAGGFFGGKSVTVSGGMDREVSDPWAVGGIRGRAFGPRSDHLHGTLWISVDAARLSSSRSAIVRSGGKGYARHHVRYHGEAEAQ